MDSKQALMERFIERNNIAHFHDRLKIEADPIKRETLQKLLAEEEAMQVNCAKAAMKSRL